MGSLYDNVFDETSETNTSKKYISTHFMMFPTVDPKEEILKTKTIPITNDYDISSKVLGLGVSGKVIEVINKSDKKKYALKFLPDCPKSRREVQLHWRSSICENIVKIKDVYENV